MRNKYTLITHSHNDGVLSIYLVLSIGGVSRIVNRTKSYNINSYDSLKTTKP